MSKVSIVLPSYNGEAFLRESIESVISQTYTDWELIIVDDCSTDSTPEIAKSYSERYQNIIYTRNEQNSKLPASLNRGFSLASGDYFTWTSDDNYFANDALEIMVGALDSNSDCDVVYCDINCINEKGEPIRMPKITTSTHAIPILNVVRACFSYRSKVHYELHGYDESLFLVEDYDFWLRAYRYFSFRYIDKAPYYYRFHSSSLSKTRELEIRDKTKALLQRELRFAKTPARKIAFRLGLAVNSARTFLLKRNAK